MSDAVVIPAGNWATPGRWQRAGIAWRTIWPILLLFLLELAFAIWQGARFPDSAFRERLPLTDAQLAAIEAGVAPYPFGWVDFTILAAIPYFLLIKTNVMARRIELKPIDWLALSIMAANATFGGLYHIALVNGLFQYWVATHQHTLDAILNCLRIALVVALVWSTVLLILVPEPDRVRWPWVHTRLAPVLTMAAAALVVLAWRIG